MALGIINYFQQPLRFYSNQSPLSLMNKKCKKSSVKQSSGEWRYRRKVEKVLK